MPPRSNDFQKLIHFLETELAPIGANVREPAMVQPLDGREPIEVDVLVEADLGPHSIKVALECRDHGRPATQTWIHELAGRYAVLPVDRIVAVSRSGFTKGARHRARGTKIQLMTLAEARETDWPETLRGWRVAFVAITPTPTALRVVYRDADPGLEGAELAKARVVDPGRGLSSTILDDAQGAFRDLGPDMIREWWPTLGRELIDGPAKQVKAVDLRFNADGKFVQTPDGSLYAVDALVLTVDCTITVERPHGQFYAYGRTRLSQFSDESGGEVTTHFTLLLDDKVGLPARINILRESLNARAV